MMRGDKTTPSSLEDTLKLLNLIPFLHIFYIPQVLWNKYS